MKTRTSLVIFMIGLVIILAACAHQELSPSPDPEQEVLETGRQWTAMFFDGRLEELEVLFSVKMREALPLATMTDFRKQVIDGLGEEVALLSEEARIQPVMVVYERLARHAKEPDAEIMVTWQATRLADGSLEIIGFSIAEPKREAESRFLAYRTKTDLRLPFTGRWQVFWGGRTIEQNYHARVVDQRFAYDFLMVKDGSTHRGEGKENGDYYCFGAEIVAPGGGLVVSAENKVPESPPGTKNPKQPLGNHVIIDHGNGEFSFLAHLKEGSVVVSTGDAVEQGQRLGACGNSGNTTEPHLHYHLQNTAVVFKGEGLPAQFRKYMANGELIEMGEPVQGDVIEHAE